MLSRLKRQLRRTLKQHMWLAPRSFRSQMIRRMVRLEAKAPAGLEIRVARHHDEHAAAYKLLHDAYVASGYMAPQASGMRLSPYQLVPNARALIAVVRGEVVATCSLIPDSALGLPMESVFDLSRYRRQGLRLGEISALAVKEGYRGNLGRILFPMIKYFFEYGQDVLGINAVVLCVQPRHFEFYRAFLNVQPIPKGYAAHYGSVAGAPAQAGILNFAASLKWGERLYRTLPPDRNLYDYIVHRQLAHIEPATADLGAALTPPVMRELFKELGTLQALTSQQRDVLSGLYAEEAYRQTIAGLVAHGV